MADEKGKAHLRITGRVQGVFFRATARDRASKLQLNGWIKNLADGSVESVVEGAKNNIEEYIKFCKEGSSAAKVKNVEVEWLDYENEFSDFEIRYI